MALVKTKVLYNDTDYIDNVYQLQWEQPHLSMDNIPTFSFKTDNFHGRNYNQFGIGKDIKIYRNGEKVFTGVIEPKMFSKSASENSVTIEGKHKGYIKLRNAMCEVYRAATTSGVLNAWEWGRKNAAGEEVDGINPSDIYRNLIGTLFTWQEFFDNRMAFINLDADSANGFIGVALFDNNQDGNAQLTGRPSGTQWLWGSGTTPGQVHSVALHNGPFIEKSGTTVRGMGEVQSVTVKLYGDKNGTIDPVIRVCRDGNNAIASRTYNTVTLNSPATGTNVLWSGTYTFNGSESSKNRLAFVLYPNGSGSDSTGLKTWTNRMDYLRLDAVTTSDVGLTEGTIDTYVNPSGHAYKGESGDTLAINLAGLNRLEACERVRKATITPDSITDSPYYDMWIDNDLKAHFVQRRGVSRSSEYSFAKFNVTSIKHDFDANNVVNNVIAKGAGAPPFVLTVISDDLVDLDSITKYGNRQGVFQDNALKDAYSLYTRARSFFKLHKDPIETVKTTIVNEWSMPWNVGDRIKVRDTDIGVDGEWRIISARHTINSNGGETIDVELGTKSVKSRELLKNLGRKVSDQELFYQGTASNGVTSSQSIPFDKNKPAVYSFIIPEGVEVDRVYVYASTEVFTANSKSAAGGGGGTVTSTGSSVTTTSGSAHTHRIMTVSSDPGGTWSDIFVTVVDSSGDVNYNLKIPAQYIAGETGTIRASPDFPAHTHGMDHTHDVVIGSHTHGIVFGIYEFSGDDGAFGGPMYPTQIQMFVDKLPSDAGAVSYEGWGFQGKTNGSVTIDKLDITEALKDANGKIRPGSHFLAFKPQGAETNNAQNLGRIAVNHFIKFNTKGDRV